MSIPYDEEHLKIITCLLKWQAKLNAKPKHGCLKSGRRKSNRMQRKEGHCILYADYFSKRSTYTTKDFRRRFRMNKKLFNVREYDNYLLLKNCTKIWGRSHFACRKDIGQAFDMLQSSFVIVCSYLVDIANVESHECLCNNT
jgi:hypothetical protein